MKKALIIAPGLDNFISEFSIKEIDPDHICFLATKETIPLIGEIVAKMGISSYDLFIIKDIFSTKETIEEFFRSFQKIIEKGDIEEIFVDATNCITVIEMATYVSASLLDLFKSTLKHNINFRFVYIHSEYEIKENGIAGEIRGTERIVELERPIESLSFVLAIEAVGSFNKGKYSRAADNFLNLFENSFGERHLFYKGLHYLALSYERWDQMDLEKAIEYSEESKSLLSKIKRSTYSQKIISALEENINLLKKLNLGDEIEIILDLRENSLRREREGFYDDSLARLYACLEHMSQVQLKRFGLETKNPDYSSIPEEAIKSLKEEFGDLPRELELKKSIYLLLELGDPLGNEIKEITFRKFVGLLGLRNNSILAHGLNPISKKSFEDFKTKLFSPLFKKFIEIHEIEDKQVEKHNHLRLENFDLIRLKD